MRLPTRDHPAPERTALQSLFPPTVPSSLDPSRQCAKCVVAPVPVCSSSRCKAGIGILEAFGWSVFRTPV